MRVPCNGSTLSTGRVRAAAERWLVRAVLRNIVVYVGIALAVGMPVMTQAADAWLFVNDIHFDAASRASMPNRSGDTNAPLLDSAIREMQRVSPHPPVIVMAGDFLSHYFKPATAVPTLVGLARRFDRAFPHAQVVMALGNEDSACGDYAVAPNSAFLRAVAAAWVPLVNRNGAAPDFQRTFPRDGFYTATLPGGVRAVVVDNAFWSPFFHPGCGSKGDPTSQSFGELTAALGRTGNERRWIVMHIPPGVDASSTVHLTHRLAIVPFMRPGPRDAILQLIGDPARRVELVVTGHVHRFAFRVIGRKDGSTVPLLVSPAISPIFGNSPSFLTADVATDGVVRNLEEHSFVDRQWRNVGGLTSLGVSEFSGSALVNLERRLGQSLDVRAKFAELYIGDAPRGEIDEHNWRSYLCAAREFNSTAYRDCLDEGGLGFLTRRGVFVVGLAIAGALFVAAAVVVTVVSLFRRRAR